MKWRRASVVLVVGATALAAVGGGACGNDTAVVGGECAPGRTDCNLHCVDLLTDPSNCGACGNVCPPSVECSGGVCGGAGDASPTDGSSDGDAPGTPDGVSGDGLADGSDDTGDACMPPYNTAQHCGDCFTACSGLNDACKPSDGGWACQPLCDPPLSECSGQCFDLTSDPSNCGGCGTICPSQLCQNSLCVGTSNGNVVFIGHDYLTTPPGTAQARVLSNAAFLRPDNPLHVMSFERYADPTAVQRVTTILTGAAQQLGRTLTITSTITDADIPNKLKLQSFQVLLVHDQPSASSGVLGPLGASWASTLTSFTKAGGVVIVLDGAAGTTQEMPQLTTSTTLLTVSAQTPLTPGTPVDNIAQADAVGVGVITPYGAGKNSARVASEANGGAVTWVVQWTGLDAGGPQPVVVHKTIQ